MSFIFDGGSFHSFLLPHGPSPILDAGRCGEQGHPEHHVAWLSEDTFQRALNVITAKAGENADAESTEKVVAEVTYAPPAPAEEQANKQQIADE